MLNLNIQDKFFVGKDITANIIKRVAESNSSDVLLDIESIQWMASFRPRETGLSSYEDDARRFEEIQLFEMSVYSTENIYTLSRIIMAKIAYPIILLVRYKNKYRVTISKPAKNKRDYGEQVIRSLFQTFWFFPDEPEISLVTMGIIQALDFSRYDCYNLYELHAQMFNNLLTYKTRGITKAKVGRLVKWLNANEPKRIYDACTPTKYHPPKYVINGYAPERMSNYLLLHDIEDVWHALMLNDRTREKIENRRIKNIEELLYYSDEY